MLSFTAPQGAQGVHRGRHSRDPRTRAGRARGRERGVRAEDRRRMTHPCAPPRGPRGSRSQGASPSRTGPASFSRGRGPTACTGASCGARGSGGGGARRWTRDSLDATRARAMPPRGVRARDAHRIEGLEEVAHATGVRGEVVSRARCEGAGGTRARGFRAGRAARGRSSRRVATNDRAIPSRRQRTERERRCSLVGRHGPGSRGRGGVRRDSARSVVCSTPTETETETETRATPKQTRWRGRRAGGLRPEDAKGITGRC